MLFNSEACHNFTQNQVEAFEKNYEALLCWLVIGHAKVPALYRENGQVPKYILACKRLLCLQTILQRDPDELVHKVYLAQRVDPSQGDFCLLVDNDRLLLDCCITDEQIGQTSKYDFKIFVKKKAKEQAFRTLMAIKDTKTKMDNITYTNNFQTQPYITSISRKMSSLLMALRMRTCRGIRSDFGDMFPNKECPWAGCSQPDSLPHTLACQVLLAAVPEPSAVQYGDVFSDNVAVQEVAVNRFALLLEAREQIQDRQDNR